MRGIILALMSGLVTLATGCATITGSETQPLSITTQTDDGQIVQTARCTLHNDKGAWSTDSPGFVNVGRSAEDLMIECKKAGLPDGFARAISRAHGGMWGNIIFGGGVGAIIDHSKGTGYAYPNTVPVRMGRSIVVDRSNESQVREEPAAAGSTAPAAPASGTSPTQTALQAPAPPQPNSNPPSDAVALEVEKLARENGCTGSKAAERLTEPGAVETYRVGCDAGSELIVKCEYRKCRILR